MDRTDKQRSDSIGQTVLQTVAQKSVSIWQSLRQKYSGTFFLDMVSLDTFVKVCYESIVELFFLYFHVSFESGLQQKLVVYVVCMFHYLHCVFQQS